MAKPGRGLEKKDSSLMFREISPPYGWKDDRESHYLRLTLPGFEAKDITIRMDKYGHLVVRGNRQITEHKYISFEETFDVPSDGELEQADGFFEDNQIYCVTIPKKKDGHPISTAHQKQTNKPGPVDGNIGTPHESTNPDHRFTSNPLKVVTGNKFQKRIALSMALLLVLLFVTVFLILKYRHH